MDIQEGVMPEVINTLIIDDHPMVCDGLKSMLEVNQKYNFKVTVANKPEDGIALVQANPDLYDLAIVDYQLSGMTGADTISRILSLSKNIKCLALSNYDEFAHIRNMLDLGARGYVLKNIDVEELILAIETIFSGKKYYSNDVANKLIDGDSSKRRKRKLKVDLHKKLSKREIQILKMIIDEMTNEEISEKLFISKRTVDTHRQNIIAKLDVRNTAGLVKVALSNNLQ